MSSLVLIDPVADVCILKMINSNTVEESCVAVKININKPSELQFDVNIQGADTDEIIVRFVLLDINGCDYSFNCTKVEDSKKSWKVKLPKISSDKSICKFRLEVIIDEYYFEPVNSEVQFITSKDVSATIKQNSKPKVSTSLTEEDKPQFQVISLDEDEIKYVESTVVPFVDIKETPIIENEQSAQQIASQLIRNVTGGFAPVSDKKLSLFKRNSNGDIIEDGFDSDSIRQQKADKAQKIRDIISQN